MSRPPRLRLLLVAALLAGAAGIGAAGHLPGGPGEGTALEGAPCPDSHPILLPVEGVAGLSLCADPSARSTLIVNDTRAVWAVRVESGTPLSRGRMSPLTASFLDLVAQTAPVVPASASVLVLAPPAAVGVAVDADLTVAQLVHDQLVSTLDYEDDDVAEGALRLQPGGEPRMLALCVEAVAQRAGPSRAVLADAALPQRLEDAALATAAATWSGCGAAWLETKLDGGVDPKGLTSLAYDVRGWSSSSTLELRGALAAAAARSAGAIRPASLTPRLG
ncbi:MAG TPA: hypothetical protein VIL55_05170 [Naasia sp.]